jgi:tRNA (guanine-N7-)-methyltransferase
VKADATSYLSTHFQPASIDTLHVYFTDPWPKKRHAKRRLFQPSFVEMVHRVLRPNGQLLVKVDLFWYFEEIFGLIERSPRFEVLASGSETDSERDLYEVTAFEHKALVKKGAVFFLRARNLANE